MVGNNEVEAQLRKILESPAFCVSARSRQFLEFCVDRAMHGEPYELKETTIAIEVFQRATDYNPKIDPIVRVHARRVRQKLEIYYKDFGADDPIKIDIPKGGYVPLISRSLPRRKTDFTDWAPAPFLPAEELQRSARAVALPPAITLPHLPNWRDVRWILAWMVGIVTALVIFYVSSAGSPHQVAPASLSPLAQLDLQSDRVSQFAWSPDNERLAYTAIGKDNKSRIYIQAGQGLPTPILDNDTYDESYPAWSPDGREIAFARRIGPARFELMRCELSSKTLASLGKFLNYLSYSINAIALDWSPDGRFIVTSDQAGPSDPVRLVLVSLANGARTPLTSPPTSSTGDLDARFSPDGNWIAFQRGGLGDLYLVSVKGEQSHSAVRLTLNNPGVRGIAWTNHGQSLLFGTSDDKSSAYRLSEIARSGGTPEPVSPQGFDAAFPAVSNTGKLAIEHREITTSVVEYSLADSSERVRVPADSQNSSPELSPGGDSLVYANSRSGCRELWLSQPGASAPKQITNFQCAGKMFFPAWAPDGKSIAFSYRLNGATNLFMYRLFDQKLQQITHTRNRDITPIFSSDGRYIYYSSNDDGTSRIWRLRTDGSSLAEPTFVEGTTGFAPSLDGKWLYFLRPSEGTTLVRQNLETGDSQELFHVSGRPTFAKGFQVAGNRIFIPISQDDISASDVYVIDPLTSTARVILHLKGLPPFSDPGPSGFSVSGDGSKLVAERVERYKTTLYTAVLNH